MSCTLVRSSAEQLTAISQDPDILDDLISLSGASRIEGTDIRRTAAALDLGKSFDGLNYLLNDGAMMGDTPLSFMYGGRPLTEEEYGLAPPLGHAPQVVKQIAAALDPIDAAWIKTRYDARRLDEDDIYPNDWTDDPDGGLQWLLHSLAACKGFIAEAALAQDGLVVIHS
ncbi:DUF1877 family protein [Actibacterium sp. 188UL27-1]|uniref:DUF1877 family protein n=1 Tax=Actibacterium sp. 188UL27-1 TaxID=2786961 RepID=UPI00195D1A83|nr:DUF1877 family protein [Actibacterium sp. 188UL27-1]MBM7067676.1 DUF1877 family protein [Actibacterium sp. 188UL27-1]